MHEITPIDRKGLREFGLLTGAIVAGLFGLFFPWLLERAIPLWPWIVAAVLGGWGLIAPQSLRPVYHGWMKFGLLLSKITTPIILGVVYFGVMLPIGLLMRLRGKDPMARKFDTGAKSYRVTSHNAPKENVERPF
jgi:hypothetical protein